MTTLHHRPTTALTELELIRRQLEGIQLFTATHARVQAAAEAGADSREMRMDAARRLAVARRQHEALVQRSHDQLLGTGIRPLTVTTTRRAVIAHRSTWFAERLSALLAQAGVTVLARPENGADVVGIAIAEQPDLVLVEEALEMLPGEEVVRELRTYCPGTLIAAQVGYSDRVGAMLDAGATTAFVRQVPPADVAEQLCELLDQSPPLPTDQVPVQHCRQ